MKFKELGRIWELGRTSNGNLKSQGGCPKEIERVREDLGVREDFQMELKELGRISKGNLKS